jgi:hypothetical protein
MGVRPPVVRVLAVGCGARRADATKLDPYLDRIHKLYERVVASGLDQGDPILENAPKALARIILAEQAREALGHNEAED